MLYNISTICQLLFIVKIHCYVKLNLNNKAFMSRIHFMYNYLKEEYCTITVYFYKLEVTSVKHIETLDLYYKISNK